MYRTSTPDYILENRNNFRALVEVSKKNKRCLIWAVGDLREPRFRLSYLRRNIRSSLTLTPSPYTCYYWFCLVHIARQPVYSCQKTCVLILIYISFQEGIALACYKNPGWQTWHLIKKACLGCEYENGSQDEHICMMDQEGFVIDVIRQLVRHVIPYDLYKRQVVLGQMAYIVVRDREKFEQLKLVDFLNMWSGQENTFYYDPFLAVDGDSVEKHYRTLMGEESAPDSSASGELYEPAAKKSG